jgi:hypothetical protein
MGVPFVPDAAGVSGKARPAGCGDLVRTQEVTGWNPSHLTLPAPI